MSSMAMPPVMGKPVKEVPGTTGWPVIGAISDRLEFYYFQGQDKYFQSRVDKYGSTVVRINVPPGPTMARNPRVVALLDAVSFRTLIDTTLVEKKDVFTGTFMPPTSLTGGYRVLSYLDPSESHHELLKKLLFAMLASRKDHVIPAFSATYRSLFVSVESQIHVSGASDFVALNDVAAFDFLGEAYFSVRPSATSLGSTGPTKAAKWLLFNLHPLISVSFLPKFLQEPLLHTFHLPSFLVSGDYKALYAYFSSAAGSVLDKAVELGLSREEACHNLLFATVFNSYGGFKILLPSILSSLATVGPAVHARLAKEIRGAVAEAGGKVTLAAVEKMELANSAVYECLRLDPPVKFQYGKAKADMAVESHDALYSVKKGEMLFSYQPMATRDRRVFGDDADKFVVDRFVGEGKKLLQYVYWSNGREDESTTLGNKQCAGKDFVVLVGRLFVVELFLRYDTFVAKATNGPLGEKVEFTAVTRAVSDDS